MARTKEGCKRYSDRKIAENPDYWKNQGKKWRLNNPRNYLLYKTRRRKKFKSTLTIDDIIIPEYCPVLGVKLETFNGINNRDNVPSVDRIDSSKDYVKGNIQVMSWRANFLKANGTLEEFKKLVKWMEGNGTQLSKGD